jgi:small subunit ribosomal protein S6
MAKKKTEKALKTNQYEGMFLFGSAAATEPQAAEQTVRKFIEAHGGKILVLKKWDERKLAYEIRGNKRGTYFLSLFSSPPAAVGQIERDVKLSEDVLRCIILKGDHLNAEEVQAMEPQKPEPREERGFGFERSNYGDRGGYGGGGDRGGYGDRGGGGGGYGDRDRGPRGPRREEGAPEGAPAGDDR